MSALKIDPIYFEANFNLGVFYYNDVSLIQQVINMAGSATPNDPALVDQMKTHFQKSRFHLEKRTKLDQRIFLR